MNIQEKIKVYIRSGFSVRKTRKDIKGAKLGDIKRSYRQKKFQEAVGVCFGSKTESYFTEEELLTGYTPAKLKDVLKEFKKSK